MKKSRFSDSQIIKALKRVEGGLSVPEVCRELGIGSATFYSLCGNDRTGVPPYKICSGSSQNRSAQCSNSLHARRLIEPFSVAGKVDLPALRIPAPGFRVIEHLAILYSGLVSKGTKRGETK